MIDFPAVSLMTVQGDDLYSRVRVLWQDGIMRAYNRDGWVFDTVCSRPVKLGRKGFHVQHVAETTLYGVVVMNSRCSTCGGWRKITKIKAEKLWEMS